MQELFVKDIVLIDLNIHRNKLLYLYSGGNQEIISEQIKEGEFRIYRLFRDDYRIYKLEFKDFSVPEYKGLWSFYNYRKDQEGVICEGIDIVNNKSEGCHIIELYDMKDTEKTKKIGSLQLHYQISTQIQTNSSPRSSQSSLLSFSFSGSPAYKKIVNSFLSTFIPECSLEGSTFVQNLHRENYEYTGYLVNEKMEGKGVLHYISGKEKGEFYFGSFSKSQKSGIGVYIYADGDYYEGEWKENLENGHGIYTFIDGDQYKGDWKDGNMNGMGIYKTNDGDCYEGEWKEDEMNGFGVYKYSNGEVYEGTYILGKKSGHGKYKYNNGDIYEGEWKNDCFEGIGTYSYQTGDQYIGEWKADKREGKGTYYCADGVIESGIWNQDKLVRQDKKYVEYFYSCCLVLYK